MPGNFGIHNRDYIGRAYFVRGTIVIDENRNIFANSLTLENSLNMLGNVTNGNLAVTNLITCNKLAANDIMSGNITGKIYDENEKLIIDSDGTITTSKITANSVCGILFDTNSTQVVGLQAAAEPNPPPITPMAPMLTLPPAPGMPPFALPPPTLLAPGTSYAPGDVIDVLVHTVNNLQMEVGAQRATIISLLDKLRAHGLIAP